MSEYPVEYFATVCYLNKNSVKRIVTLLTGCVLVSAFFSESGTALAQSEPIPVPTEGSTNINLWDYLNGATSGSHTFRLDADVELSRIFELKGDAHRKIVIDGNGKTITKTATVLFWLDDSGSDLTLTNAFFTSTTNAGTWGALSIEVGKSNVKLNLDGTTVHGHTGLSLGYAGGMTSLSAGVQVSGNVTFEANRGSTSGAPGAVSAYDNASITFVDSVTFLDNSAPSRGGAVGVYNNALITFKSSADFSDNYSTGRSGGAIDIHNRTGAVVFEDDVSFSGNYVANTTNAPVLGGAVNIGYDAGGSASAASNLTVLGTAEFNNNYVSATHTGTSANAFGGAIASSGSSNPLAANPVNSHSININTGIFTDNYAYSQNQGGYGGAIFSNSIDAGLSLGSGSSFSGNMASTLGGAIYFKQGTINLTGDITFEGNRHGVAFATVGGVPTPNASSGRANAIYFGESTRDATLNLTPGAGQTIRFRDPIESAVDRSVRVNQTGGGRVIFTDHSSDILAMTHIANGTFELGDGASYGRSAGANAGNSYFNVDAGSAVVGGAGSALRARAFNLAGRIESTTGVFYLEGADVVLSNTSVVAINIFGTGDNSSIDAGGQALHLNEATLEVTATNYVPSQNISDTFTIVSNLAAEPVTFFAQGETITINGAEFAILYNANNIVLQQLTIPEPSTYALLLGAGALAYLAVRSRRPRVK